MKCGIGGRCEGIRGGLFLWYLLGVFPVGTLPSRAEIADRNSFFFPLKSFDILKNHESPICCEKCISLLRAKPYNLPAKENANGEI